MSPIHQGRTRVAARIPATGFSLLEIMIALALGLLLSIGIVSLFGNTSHTNRMQNGLARLQENGRFAVTRIEQDLRMFGAQYCSNTAGANVANGAGIVMLGERAPMVYAEDINLPDSFIHSIDPATGNPSDMAATNAYALSPRWFVQGYSCSESACSPNIADGIGQIPDMGLADGRRVPGSDVLTVRYQNGTGWTVPVGACSIAPTDDLSAGTTISLFRQQGDDAFDRLKPGLALVTDCVSPAIIPVSDVAGGVVTVGNVLGAGENVRATGALCAGNRTRDMRLFNFSDDFVTVSYYLAFREDDNPDARPNSSAAKRLIPVLVRREGGQEQELVRGVDQLAFRYGVQDSDGAIRFLTASEVEDRADCPPPPDGVMLEPGCAWRNVRSIESHLLVNTVDEIFNLDDSARTWRFDGTVYTLGGDEALPSGLKAGNMPRREFVSYTTGRNRSF